jgi:aspartyl/asparaginyl-tRNA synthetase
LFFCFRAFVFWKRGKKTKTHTFFHFSRFLSLSLSLFKNLPPHQANDDGKTVAAMDILVPGVGELVGGSQREERLEVLVKKLEEMGEKTDASSPYSPYLDLRRYGRVPHAGFGVGFERLVQFVAGLDNIRDSIPFPRWPNNASF